MTSRDQGHPDDDIRPIYLILGMLCLTLEIILSLGLASMVKSIKDAVPFFTILLARYTFCLPLLFIYGVWQRGSDVLKISNWNTLILRIISGMLGLFTWFGAVIYIDISLASAFFQTLPIFITIMAPFVIAERVGWNRIGAVFVGFLGVMVLVWEKVNAPSFSDTGVAFGIALALASPFFAAIMFLMLRQLGKSNPPATTALWYNATGMVVSLVLVLWLGEDMVAVLPYLPILILIGVLASFQQFLMAASHAYAPASVLAPVHFLTIPFGVLAGAMFFGERPSVWFYFGAAIILLANSYIIMREHKRQKAMTARNA